MGGVDGIGIAADENVTADTDPSLYDEDGVLYGGYEDEETWREISRSTLAESATSQQSTSGNSHVSLFMVCLPELPAGAEAEVELILASRKAASCLDISNGAIEHSYLQYNCRDNSN